MVELRILSWKRVPCPKGCKRLGQDLGSSGRVLKLHQMRRTREDITFSMWQPCQEQAVRFVEARREGVALAAEHGRGRLANAPCLRQGWDTIHDHAPQRRYR